MDFFNYFIKSKNKNNETDSGLKYNEPRENKIIEEKLPLLKKFENKDLNLNNVNKKKSKIKNLSLKHKMILIKNFINLINQNSSFNINIIKNSLSTLLNIDNKNIYLISFYSEFSDNEHIRPFNIFFITILDNNQDIKNLDITDKIAYIDILGSKSFSDISFGTDYELFKGKLINIFKEKPLELILKQTKIDNYLNKKEYVSKDSYERGFPKKEFKTIEPLYEKSTKEYIKIQIGDKCLSDKNNRVILNECKESEKYKIKDNKIINKNNYCLSYHENNDLTFIPCETKEICDNNNKINSCKNIKFIKYGGLKIDKLNKCLNKQLELDECYKVDKQKLLN